MSSDDLAAVAGRAPPVAQVRAFVEWVGGGRPLTQTGRLRRADALALVELLGTGDVLDLRYPIQSSSELHRLTLLVEWAKACGLVRVVHGRIVPVRKHARSLDEPVELVARMLAAIPRLGDELGGSVVLANAAHTLEAVFGDLVGIGGSAPVERACAVAWSTAMTRFWFPDLTGQQVEFQRRFADGDVARVLDAVAGVGVLTVADGVVALTPLGSRVVRAWLGLGTASSDLLSVKVTLRDSADPVIWRRLRVPADIRLDRFHQVLGAAMGWQDCHLHVFECGPERYGFPDPELDIRDDREVTLGALLVRPGDRLDYEYDFGDGWQHDVVLEAVEQAGGNGGPRCLDGAGWCPPEDVGGIPGFQELRRVLASPGEDGHAEMLAWLGIGHAAEFDAAAFSVHAANDAIAGVPVVRTV